MFSFHAAPVAAGKGRGEVGGGGGGGVRLALGPTRDDADEDSSDDG